MRRILLFVVIALAGALALGTPDAAGAHARLEGGDPAPGSALIAAPDAIRLTFSEAIEPGFSRASLLTATGDAVPLGSVAADPADDTVVVVQLAVPKSLAPGPYTLVWRVLSAVDGHVTTGTLAFSVGTGQAPANPGTVEDAARPSWSRVLAGWLELAGLVLVVGAFTFGGLIARPLWAGVAAPAIARAIRWVWWPAAGGLVAGMLGTLWSQGNQLGGGSGVYGDLLIDSTFGRWWLVRLGLIALLVPLAVAVTGLPGRAAMVATGSSWRWWLGTEVGAAALVTLPLSGHAAAADRTALAVATDFMHLAGAAIWLGGLAYLVATLVTLGQSDPAASAALARRFSLTALGTMLALITTGAVNGALHVAGPRTLTDQDYGVTLIAKLLVVLVVLIVAAVNLLITVPRLHAAVATGQAEIAHALLAGLRVTVALEVIGGAGILIGSAILTELPPADAPLPVDVAARVVTIDQRQPAGDVEVWLLGRLTGQASDRFTLSLDGPDGQPLANTQRVIVEIRTTAPDGESIGDRFDAEPLAGSTESYVFPATRLGLNAAWSVDVIVRRAGVEDSRAAFIVDTNDAGARPPRLVDDRWRMPRLPLTTWLLLGLSVAAVVGGIVGLRRLPGLEPLAGGVVLTMAVLIAAGFAVTAIRQTVPQTSATSRDNPFANDPGAVQRGASIYAAQCLACHGATGGGPNEDDPTDDPEHQHGANADLTSRRATSQRDGDLYSWVTDGVPGTDMPAFDHALTNEERWAVIEYLRALQDGAAVGGE
ncbi:MAG: copper resistance protein CopC [Thermomicrobiales bacterium]